MNPEPDAAAIRAAERLEQSVDGLREEIGTLRDLGQRNRRLIWGLAVSLILDVLLSVAVAVVAVKSTDAADRATEATSLANRNRQTQVATCLASNDTRAANIQLWNYVLDLAAKGNPNPTPQQTERIKQFKTYLAEVFAPRDCNASTPTAVPPPTTPPSR